MRKISVEDKIQIKQLLYYGKVLESRTTDTEPSAAFNSGGMIKSLMFVVAMNRTGPTVEKGFSSIAWIGRQVFYGTTAVHFMFAKNNWC